MAPLPKRRHSTMRGGKRWNARAAELKKQIKDLNPVKNKHLRSLTAK